MLGNLRNDLVVAKNLAEHVAACRLRRRGLCGSRVLKALLMNTTGERTDDRFKTACRGCLILHALRKSRNNGLNGGLGLLRRQAKLLRDVIHALAALGRHRAAEFGTARATAALSVLRARLLKRIATSVNHDAGL